MGISRGQTPNQKAYNKEVRRLTNAIKRGEKKGLIFPEDMLPEMPKRVTQKRVQELKKIKPKDLYLRATNFGTVYSETTTNKQRVSIQEEPKKNRTTKTPQVETKKIRISEPKEEPIKTPRVKKQKRKLTAEEKHRIAVERGRKAWQTRVQNVGGYGSEGYEKMVNEMVKRLHPETITKEDIINSDGLEFPTFDFIEEFGLMIQGLERKAPPPIPIEVRKTNLYYIYQDNVQEHIENDTLTEYANYLNEKLGEVTRLMDLIEYYDSEQQQLENSFAELASIINEGALNAFQAEMLSEETEYEY